MERDETVLGLVRRFSRLGLIAAACTLPVSFLEGYDLGLSTTTRVVAGGLFVALLAAGAVVPWARVLHHRLGRTLLDLQAVGTLAILAAVEAAEGPIPSAAIGATMVATLAAFHVTRRGMFTIAALIAVTGVVDVLQAPDTPTRATMGSIWIITAIVVATVRRTSHALRRSLHAQAELRQASEEQVARLEVVTRAVRQMSTRRPQEVLDHLAAATEHLGWELCGIYVEDEPGGRLRFAAHHNLPAEVVDRRFPRDVGAVGRVLRERRTVVVEDYGNAPAANRFFATRGLRTVVGVPMIVDGELGGVVVAGTTAAFDVSPSDVHALELLAGQAGRAVELAQHHVDQADTIAELRALDRMKNDFLATVSHELRTPLTVILGLAKVLDTRRDAVDEDVLDQMIRRLRRNATSLDEIISTLLDIRRLEAGSIELDRRLVQLTDVAAEVVERLSPLLEHHAVELDWDAAAWVVGDRVLLGRVLENLLANAARHTPPGTSVRLAVGSRDGRVRVGVADDGPGIQPADLARLGERFFRGGEVDTRPTRGIGLGLAFCRQVLQLHGTDLTVDSVVGRGASFSFELPEAEVPTPSTSPVPTGMN